MKDTAFVRKLSLQISDFINNNDQKLGKVSDSATMRTQNAEIATTLATNQKRRAPDPPKPNFKQNIINSNAQKLGEGSDAAKITTQNAEIAKTPKRNAPDPPKTKPKPSWRRESGKKHSVPHELIYHHIRPRKTSPKK